MTGAAASGHAPTDARPTLAVAAWGIVKEFGFRRVLDGVSIELPRGTFLAVFGPNGAGKTTLVKILASVSRPSSGRVAIEGRDPRGPEAGLVRSRIGYISHQTLLYDGLTALENLLFFGGLYCVPKVRERAEALLADLHLWDRRHDRAGSYSRGMLQRLTIARALMHDPEILFLDEPFAGLDPSASRVLADLLARLRRGGRSSVIATHDLEGGLALSDRWAVLARGRVRAEGASAGTTEHELAAAYFAAVEPSAGPRGEARV